MKRLIAILLAMSTLAVLVVGCSGKKEELKTFDWNTLILGSYLPIPESNVGDAGNNFDDRMVVFVDNYDKNAYDTYVTGCEEKGFQVDSVKEGTEYTAYNAEGYKLELSYNSYSSRMTIVLEAPMEMSEIGWPASALASQIPVPKSNYGDVLYNTDTLLSIYIGNMDKTAFGEYVSDCMAEGFDVDYEKNDVKFKALNEKGYKLELQYEGFNIIHIRVTPPAEVETAEPTTEPTIQETEKPESGVSEEFREAMDAYEAYFDEYIEFMETYKENPTDLKLLAKYAEFMGSYAKTMEKMSAMEDQEMTTAEAAYYLEVTSRITQKLAKIGA